MLSQPTNLKGTNDLIKVHLAHKNAQLVRLARHYDRWGQPREGCYELFGGIALKNHAFSLQKRETNTISAMDQ